MPEASSPWGCGWQGPRRPPHLAFSVISEMVFLSHLPGFSLVLGDLPLPCAGGTEHPGRAGEASV